MLTLQRLALLALLAGVLGSCHSATSPGSSNTLQLTSRTIVLSGTDTVSTVNAQLTCGCQFRMESMTCWGDTDIVRFNTSDLGVMRNQQGIMATAMRNRCRAQEATACLAFVVNDQMMNRRCMDTVTVHYYRQ